MNTLSSTSVFKTIDEFMNVTTSLQKMKIEEFIIPEFSYTHLSEFRGYKYPMAKIVTDALKAKKIIPVHAAEPVNQKTKPVILPNLFAFPVVIDNQMKIAADLSSVASYVRTKGTGSIEVLKIDQKTFYAFCQAATSYYLMRTHDSSLSTGKFADTLAELYAPMLAKSLDRIHPFSQSPDDYDLLTFLIAAFFFRTLMGQEMKQAYKSASDIRVYSDKKISTISQSAQTTVELDSFEALIAAIETEFKNVKKGAFDRRILVNAFTRAYGTNANLAIEHSFSFFNMIQMSNVWTGLFNDRMINTIASTKLKILEEILSALSL